jgi:hypothetical protein
MPAAASAHAVAKANENVSLCGDASTESGRDEKKLHLLLWTERTLLEKTDGHLLKSGKTSDRGQ